LFRIASISKAFTAVGILSLVEEGTLTLNDRPLQILNFEPPANASIDPRLNDITLEHLLLHAGGWDIFSNFEPQGLPWAAMAGHVLGEPQPSSAETLIRFMLGFPLDFDPGTRSSYSNFGFNVLGRVIEQVTGQGYEEFTQQRILTPAGIERMRLGKTRREDRAPGEVNYYAPPGAPLLPSVFPGEGFTSLPYGAFYVESYDSHGGWIASAADLIRFATAVDGQRGDALLTPASVEAMLNTPRPSETVGGSRGSFGLGWEAAPTANGVEWSRDGGLPGSTAARLVKSPDGIAFAFIFNSLPLAWEEFFVDAETAIRGALTDVETWPEDDQFTD
jgi:N-acyl-D-amino-acid deacylase